MIQYGVKIPDGGREEEDLGFCHKYVLHWHDSILLFMH